LLICHDAGHACMKDIIRHFDFKTDLCMHLYLSVLSLGLGDDVLNELWKVVWAELVKPMSVSEVARKASVAWDTARKYLEHLREIGILEEIRGRRERLFRLSERYMVSEYMADYGEYSVKELEDALKHMYSEMARLREKYKVVTVAELRLLLARTGSEKEFHEGWEDAVNWDSYKHKIPMIEVTLASKAVKGGLRVPAGSVSTSAERSP